MSNETADIEREDGQQAQEVEQETEQTEVETTEASGDKQATEGDESEVVISFGEESPTSEAEQEQAKAPAWVKDLRKQAREQARENRELKAKLAEMAAPKAAEELGKEPELDDPDIDFDTALFKQKWQAWNERKKAIDAKQAEAKAEAEKQQAAWNERLTTYNTAKTALKVEDYDDAEVAVNEAFGTPKAAMIITGADKPAELIYALGKSPAKLKELASINDPVKFLFAVARLETQLKVTPRKAPPPAEKAVKGSSTAVGVADKTLERLEAEAARTGDWTNYFAEQRRQRKAKAEG